MFLLFLLCAFIALNSNGLQLNKRSLKRRALPGSHSQLSTAVDFSEEEVLLRKDIYHDSLVKHRTKRNLQKTCGDTHCDEHAQCKNTTKECCVCKPGYQGNGQACLKAGRSVFMIGNLTGMINGISLDGITINVFSDVVTETTYIALDPVPPTLSKYLRVFTPSVSTFLFLFAQPSLTRKNAFSFLGWSYVRRAQVTFNTGESVSVRETMRGKNNESVLMFEVYLEGKMPVLGSEKFIKLTDYVHTYRYDKLGVIRGYYDTSFNVGTRKFKMDVGEVLQFDEVQGCENIKSSKMIVSDVRVFYDRRKLLVNYVIKAKMEENDTCGDERRMCHPDAKCIVKNGVEFCQCNIGYLGDGYSCRDVEECVLNITECPSNSICINTLGSYICECSNGFTKHGNECLKDHERCGDEARKCHSFAQCVTKDNVDVCDCNVGYIGDGESCEDANECALDIDQCSVNANCVNTVGSYVCICSDGYTGNGTTCILDSISGSGVICTKDSGQCDFTRECIDGVCQCRDGYRFNGNNCTDVEECVLNITECPSNSICINTLGSYICECSNGFTKYGNECLKDHERCGDEARKCHSFAQCVTKDNVDVCDCNVGYIGDGESCEDANECVLDIDQCSVNANCVNTVGSYVCICSDGYTGNGTTCILDSISGSGVICTKDSGQCDFTQECIDGVCQCRDGYRFNGNNCTAVVATTPLPGCYGDNCDINAYCDRSGVIPTCRCKDGYEGNGLSCQDKDECNEGSANCSSLATCDNTFGSFICTCEQGYIGNGRQCEYIDPCEGVSCNLNSKCVVIDGSPMCKCKSGYNGDEQECQDYNECKTGRHNCSKNARCVNTKGSYVCYCSAGYIGDGFTCRSDGSCGGRKCHRNGVCKADVDDNKQCECLQGFFGNGYICVDVNECENVSLVNCSSNQQCVNTPGSYLCACARTYRWNGVDCEPVCGHCLNGGKCVGALCSCRKGYSGDRCQWVGNEFIVFTRGSTMQRLSLPPTQQSVGVLLQTSLGLLVAMDFHYVNKMIYFTDVARKAIWRVFFNGTGTEKIISEGLSSPEGIAVDYIGGNLYWTDSAFDLIAVSKLDGNDKKILFSSRLINPRSIVVYPEKGTMYWADWNRAAPKIEIANMDGGSRRIFIQQEIGLPNGLTLDKRRKMLCWTNALFGSISCANLDDGKSKVVFHAASYPFGISSFGQYLIWTDWTTRTIQYYDTGNFTLEPAIKSFPGTTGSLYGIKVVKEPDIVSHKCKEDNGGCSNLCLPNPGGRSCACADGYFLIHKEAAKSLKSQGSGLSGSGSGVDSQNASLSGSGSGSGLGFRSVVTPSTSTVAMVSTTSYPIISSNSGKTICVNEDEFRLLGNI